MGTHTNNHVGRRRLPGSTVHFLHARKLHLRKLHDGNVLRVRWPRWDVGSSRAPRSLMHGLLLRAVPALPLLLPQSSRSEVEDRGGVPHELLSVLLLHMLRKHTSTHGVWSSID